MRSPPVRQKSRNTGSKGRQGFIIQKIKRQSHGLVAPVRRFLVKRNRADSCTMGKVAGETWAKTLTGGPGVS